MGYPEAEPRQTRAIPDAAVVVAVAPDDTSKMLMLGRERFMPVRLAPAMDRFDRTCEAVASRELAHDRIALPRPRPDVVEAEKVECRVRIMAPTEPRPEVHIPRLGLVESEPVAPKTPTQNGEHSPAVLFIRKGHNGVVGVPHQLAPASQAGSHLRFEPFVQHVVQEHVR